jgi:hypothetical protein
VKGLFEKLGYAKRRATLSTAASERQIYFHPKGWFYVDVFFDKLLVANHPIDFKGRLELDYPTITVTDMLLEKIQMWEAFSAKDLKDCLTAPKSTQHKRKNQKESIDASYIAKLLAQDWGFWYTATTNLKKIKMFLMEIDRLGAEAYIRPKTNSKGGQRRNHTKNRETTGDNRKRTKNFQLENAGKNRHKKAMVQPS